MTTGQNLTDALKSFFVTVKDVNSGEIKHIAVPANMQIGLDGNPSMLNLFGGFSLNVGEYRLSPGSNTLTINEHDTITHLSADDPVSISIVNVKLPKRPRNGQIHFIKDASGFASASAVTISAPFAPGGIDGQDTQAISVDFGSSGFYFRSVENAWFTFGGNGAGSGAATNSPFVTIGNVSGLSNERALTAGDGIAIDDAGANSTVTISLDEIPYQTVLGNDISALPLSAPAPITVHQELDWIPGDNSWFFNGTATAEINLGSTNYSFERSDDFSLSIWYQQDVPLQTGIIGKKNSSNRGYTVFITATGEIRFQLVNTFPTNELQVSTPASFNDASLHNVLITYNGSSVPSGVVIYVDGVSQVLTTINNSLIATIINTEQFKIGRDGQSGASGFTGILAHASVWDRVLTAPEAAEVYNSGEFPDLLTTSAASSLIGWWKLNELDFTGVNGIIDYSSSNIDGTANTGAIKGASPVGTLIVRNTNTWGRIVPRTAGQVLTSNGLNSIPSFQNVSGVGVFDANASYVVLGVTGSLNNERALTAGTGITLTDAGAGSTVTAAINNNVVATISGSRFTGNIVATQGISGSLQQLSNGNSYLVAGSGVIITSGSGPTGQVTISATGGGSGSGADADVSYVVMAVTASLPNERALAAGTGITRTDGGAGGNVTLAINDGIVATISGSRFTGNVLTAAGLSGSLQQTSAGTSYLVAGENILIASGSGPNGQITISAPASGGSGNGADFNASFVVINTTSSLPNERSLAAGSGITILDNGPGSTVTISASGSLAISSSFAEFIPNQTTSTFIRWQFDSSTFVGNNIYTNTGVSSSLLLAMTASSPVRIVPNSPGVFRQSVGFSHGYMVAPERFANIAGNQISISTWIRPVTTGSGFKAIIAKQIISGSWTTPFAPVSIYQLNTDNALVEFAVTTAGTRTVATADTNTALKLRPEQWNNVTMVYNGVNIKGYVNAVQVANTAKTGLLDYGTNGLWFIAGNPVTNDEFYSGSIDDIRIENTAWTPEQVREQYETGIFNTYVSGSRSLISSLSGFFA